MTKRHLIEMDLNMDALTNPVVRPRLSFVLRDLGDRQMLVIDSFTAMAA